jgi:hypothetical protein
VGDVDTMDDRLMELRSESLPFDAIKAGLDKLGT